MHRLLIKFGSYSTRLVIRCWGERFSFYYVVEKSMFRHGVSSLTHAHGGVRSSVAAMRPTTRLHARGPLWPRSGGFRNRTHGGGFACVLR